MRIEEVAIWVEGIKVIASDDERAHRSEDALFMAVLESIAEGSSENPKEMARLALTSRKIDFGRYCS